MKKKIWHILSNRWFSAITAYALNACKAFEFYEQDSIITPLAGSPAHTKATELGLKCLPIKNFSLLSTPKFLKIYKEVNPDIIIVYGGPEEFLARIFTQKHLFRFRGYPLEKRLRVSQFFSRHIHYICPNNEIAADLHSSGHKHVSCIPLGIDSTLYSKTSTTPYQREQQPELVIFGRFDPIKGHIQFLKIFSQLLQKWDSEKIKPYNRPLLHIVGLEANLKKAELEAEALRLHLKPNVDYKITCELIPTPQKLLSRACLGVVSSLGSEYICRVAQEFLMCGTPLFVSGVGGLEDVLYENFGVSYKNFSEHETVDLLQTSLVKSITEEEGKRNERAQTAQKIFSLETMGKSLMNITHRST